MTAGFATPMAGRSGKSALRIKRAVCSVALRAYASLLLAATLAGCEQQSSEAPPATEGASPLEALLDDGAVWIAEMPATWNGTLLLYAHGYNPELMPPKSAPDAARDALLEAGYALAASAYPAAGWAVAEAVPSQVLALEAFVHGYGEPDRVIAWGTSMGGLVTSALAERHAELLDGAMTICASSMGTLPMMNMAFDGAYALTTLIPADPPVPVVGHGDNFDGVERQIEAMGVARRSPEGRARVALAGVLGGIPVWTQPDQPKPASTNFAAQEEQIAAAAQRGLFLPRGDQEFRSGGVYSWNTGIDYADLLEASGRSDLVRALYDEAGLDLAADIERLNSSAQVEANETAVDYMRANFTPTGRIGVPLLSVHTIGDGMTSPSLQRSYLEKIEEAGFGDLARGLWIERAGHCTQTGAEMMAALNLLVAKLDSGEWPAGMDAGEDAGQLLFTDEAAPPTPRSAAGIEVRP
jgi:pimeloyl-ACP methyl ester carboxylesterase